MYAIRVFYRMNKTLESWTTIGAWTLTQRYDNFEEANEMAVRLTRADEDGPYFKTYYVPVEIITKGRFYEEKWDEFSEAWNISVKPDTLNPLEAFETWINYYTYLTAAQYMKTL